MARGGSKSGRGGVHQPHKANRAVVAQQVTSKQQLPGRHQCTCQARIHALVRNCLGCGKIVCAQEGSGPCFFCGTLVCTKEERELLDRSSKKSAELYKKLTGKEWPEGGLQNLTLSSIASSMQRAVEFRDTLLAADKNSEYRTRVNDLESDFANVDSNIYLTKEERDAIITRRDELRAIRERRRRAMVVDIDIASKSVIEKKQDLSETDAAYDPVIRQILDRSEERRKTTEYLEEEERLSNDNRWRPIGFVPKYAGDFSSCDAQRAAIAAEHEDALCMGRLSEEATAMEVERRGLAFAIAQPAATLVVNGLIKYIRWDEDPMVVGPLFVCSSTDRADSDAINDAITRYKLPPSTTSLDFSSGSVLGRAYLAEVLSRVEYEEEGVNSSSSWDSLPGTPLSSSRFVLRFTVTEPLLTSVPHIPPTTHAVYQLDATLKTALCKAASA